MNELLPFIMDAIVIFILVFYLVRGWHRGLARTVVTMLSFLLAIILTWQLYGYVADFFRAIGVQARLAASFGAGIQAPAQPGAAEATGFIESLVLPEALKTSMVGNNNYEAYSALGVNSFGDYIGVFLANVVVNAIAVLLVFIVSLILLRIVARCLGAVNKIPLLGLANRVLGVVASGIIGACVIALWMFVFTMFATGQNVFTTMVVAIEKSSIASWFYHSNHLIDWIMQIFG